MRQVPLLPLLAVVPRVAAPAAPPAVHRLRVEHVAGPSGLDVCTPRFSWLLSTPDSARGQAQRAYSINVSVAGSTAAPLWAATGSGVLTSQVEYKGPPLAEDTQYEWSVAVQAALGGWSAPSSSTFSTGLFFPSSWRPATLTTPTVQRGALTSAPGAPNTTLLFRNVLDPGPAKGAIRATVFVGSQGFFKLHVDGALVSDHELGPHVAADRLMYSSYSIDPSAHVLGVEVGNGWHAPSVQSFRNLLVAVRYHYPVGTTAVGDSTWRWAPGAVLHADLFQGETLDQARLKALNGWSTAGYDASGWQPATASPFPGNLTQILSHALLPPIRVVREYSVVDLWESSPGVFVFDFGQNAAGYTVLNIPDNNGATKGQVTRVVHGEIVDGPKPHGMPVPPCCGADQVTSVILDGSGDSVSLAPGWSYAGFRYASVTGYPGTPTKRSIVSRQIRTGFDQVGSMSFSDPVLNGVQRATEMAASNNFQSNPTDCPTREKNEWLGDAGVTADTLLQIFDMAAGYTKFLGDIMHAASPAGAIPDVIRADEEQTPYLKSYPAGIVEWEQNQHQQAGAWPVCHHWPCLCHEGMPGCKDPSWAYAFSHVTFGMLQHYGDIRIVRDNYPVMQRHIDCLMSAGQRNFSGLLTVSLFGDWCSVDPTTSRHCKGASSILSTFVMIKELQNLAVFASILGRHADSANYTALADGFLSDFDRRFYNSTTHEYFDGMQAPLQTTMALALELAPPAVSASQGPFIALLNRIAMDGGHITSGIHGVKHLFTALASRGRMDIALSMLTR
eukprot:gene4429-803_t